MYRYLKDRSAMCLRAGPKHKAIMQFFIPDLALIYNEYKCTHLVAFADYSHRCYVESTMFEQEGPLR